jgi:hypothetical protein
MAKLTNTSEKLITSNISRPGVHSKSQTSSLKTSKNYKKLYRGQGRV